MTECGCPIMNDWEDDDKACLASGPAGVDCSKPDGHTGPHAACNSVEHPAEVWSDA